MYYLSTRNNKLEESFENILFQGLSKEGGLFLPAVWPKINLNEINNKNYEEIALQIISPYIKQTLSDENLKKIIDQKYKNFRKKNIAPLVKIDNNKYILELFHGPTFAFKDYALQFLGNLISSFLENKNKKITILGATSGDTGSAAINAFKGKNEVEVFILHPFEKVSKVQRLQMTTVEDSNIHNLAIRGNFDDCQKIVKKLFVDEEIQSKTTLTAINSINWVRIISQTVYYFWSFAQLDEKTKKDGLSFIVPSGNFGNIFSARVAKYMGLPINNLHVVTNENDILNKTINSGLMKIDKVKQTYSPSMDIQVSSNFERQLFESFNRDSNQLVKLMNFFSENGYQTLPSSIIADIKKHYKAYTVSDLEILNTIKLFNEKYKYLADPHTATGLKILEDMNDSNINISLACAHPAKFGNAIKKAIGKDPIFPKDLENIFDKKEKMTILNNETEAVKSLILKNL